MGALAGRRPSAAGAEPDGTLALAEGTRRGADLVVAADGIDSAIRDALALWLAALRSGVFAAFDRIGFLQARYQRTARHVPTGYRPAASP